VSISADAPAEQPTRRTATKWTYPFALRDRDLMDDMASHFHAMSTMKFGFFPLSASGAAQGSIHFGTNSNSALDQDAGVRCIADGEVVAYRLDSRLHRLEYDANRVIEHSLSFVLVRHRLALPAEYIDPAEGDSTATALPESSTASDASSTDDGIDIYSLYTYLRPLNGYRQHPVGFTEVTFPYWRGTRTFRVGERCRDRQTPRHVVDSAEDIAARRVALQDRCMQTPTPIIGLRIRAQGRGGAPVLGILPRGSIVTVRDGKDRGWAQLKTIRQGTPAGAIVGDRPAINAADGWVFLGEMDTNNQPDPETMDRLVVLDAPYPIKAGEVLGHLGENPGPGNIRPPTELASSRPTVALEVFAGAGFADYLTEARRRGALLPDRDKTILTVDAGTLLCQNMMPCGLVLSDDHQLIPDTEAPAGGMLVHGTLHRAVGRQPRQSVRGDIPTGFHRSTDGTQRIDSTAYAALSATAKASYPLVEALAPVTPMCVGWGLRADVLMDRSWLQLWTTAPLSLDDAHFANGHPAFFHRAELNALPNQRKFVEPDGTRWWHLEFGSVTNKPVRAWVREKDHPGTRWESPHAWPGFTLIDATMATPENTFRRHICITGQARPDEEEAFQLSASELSTSDFIRRIEAAIDKAGTLDGKVTGADIGKARSSYWLSHALSRLVVRFESQWSEDMARWRCLDSVLSEDWQADMRRQEMRAWWGVMAARLEGFPSDPTVHHIHPFGWIDNFSALAKRIDVDEFLRLYSVAHGTIGVWDGKKKAVVPTSDLNALSASNLKRLVERLIYLYEENSEEPNISHLSYMLTTARHESYDFRSGCFFGPLAEIISESDAEANYGSINARDEASARNARLNGNTEKGDGFRYRGRGFSQITWKINYAKFGRELDVDLVGDPDLAMDWDVASRILFSGMRNGSFRGNSLADHTTDDVLDYVAARNIINGDRRTMGPVLAAFAQSIEECLNAAIS
jgi:hypothetical protein